MNILNNGSTKPTFIEYKNTDNITSLMDFLGNSSDEDS